MSVGNSLNFPTFLVAKTPEDLSKAMMQNNLLHKKEFVYYDMQFVKGKWYAWYVLDHSKLVKNTKDEIIDG